VNAFTGSGYDRYKQLLWLPKSQVQWTHVHDTLHIPGDPQLKIPLLPARFWRNAAVLGIDHDELEWLKNRGQKFVEPEKVHEAVAYKSDARWHVGIEAVGATIFSELNTRSEHTVAVRRGGGDAEFSLGVYVQPLKTFFGAAEGKLFLRDLLPISGLHAESAKTYLV
jgi:hypothetical protein